jgi:hypothetical protein
MEDVVLIGLVFAWDVNFAMAGSPERNDSRISTVKVMKETKSRGSHTVTKGKFLLLMVHTNQQLVLSSYLSCEKYRNDNASL